MADNNPFVGPAENSSASVPASSGNPFTAHSVETVPAGSGNLQLKPTMAPGGETATPAGLNQQLNVDTGQAAAQGEAASNIQDKTTFGQHMAAMGLGLAHGLPDFGLRIDQLAAYLGEKMHIPGAAGYHQQLINDRQEFLNRLTSGTAPGTGRSFGFGDFISSSLPFIVNPEAGAATTAAGKIVDAGATRLFQAGLGASATPENPLLGAAIGGGAGATTDYFTKLAGKVVGKIANTRTIPKAVKALGKSLHNVPKDKLPDNLQAIANRKSGIENMIKEHGWTPDLSSALNRSQAAQDILDAINAHAGSDRPEKLLRLVLSGGKLTKQVKSDDLWTIAAKSYQKLGDINLSDLQSQLINNLHGATDYADRVIRKVAGTLGGKVDPELQKLAGQVGGPAKAQLQGMVSEAQNVPAINLEFARKSLSHAAAVADPQSKQQLLQALDQVQRKIGDVGQQAGSDVAKRVNRAVSYYRKNVVPYNKSAISGAIAKGTYPLDTWKAVTKEMARDPEAAPDVVRLLTPAGKHAMKAGYYGEALARSYDAETGGFDYRKFRNFLTPGTPEANSIGFTQAVKDVTFKGDNAQELRGIMKMMQNKRISTRIQDHTLFIMAHPFLMYEIIRNWAEGNHKFAILAASSMGAADALFELLRHPVGRRLALAADKVDPNSPAMDTILGKASHVIQKAGVGNITAAQLPRVFAQPLNQPPAAPDLNAQLMKELDAAKQQGGGR